MYDSLLKLSSYLSIVLVVTTTRIRGRQGSSHSVMEMNYKRFGLNTVLTNLDLLRPSELAFDEAVLKLSVEVGHAELRRMQRHVRVALVETGLDADLYSDMTN